MTFLEAINKVLKGLREATVADVDAAAYTVLIGQLVNEAKVDIEDLGPWQALRTTVNKNTVAGTATIDLTTETNDRSYLLYDRNLPQAFVVTTDKERRLQHIQIDELLALQALNPDHQNDIPAAVAFARAAGGMTAHLWPTPDAVYALRFRFVIPQDDMAAEATVITIPAEPVWREALVRAMEERGEEFAGPIERAVARAEQALGAAVMMDFGAEDLTFEPG